MNDPTAIALQCDPLLQRMRGRAVHGNVEFDVPFMSEIVPGLWHGGCQEGLVLPLWVDHVVSLYPWERYRHDRQIASELSVRMFDDPEQSTARVESIASWVNGLDGQVLVHCQAGLNRSSLVVATALVRRGYSPGEAIELIRARRSPACLCNPAFERFVMGLSR